MSSTERSLAVPTAVSTAVSTAADRRLYVEAGLAPVECGECGNRVLVKKNSDKHTSVQWSGSATDCPEIAAEVAAGAYSGQVLGCAALKRSIERAVQDGRLEVPRGGAA
jgi:hypothetical protein